MKSLRTKNGAPDEMKLGTAMSLLCPLISQDDIDEAEGARVRSLAEARQDDPCRSDLFILRGIPGLIRDQVVAPA